MDIMKTKSKMLQPIWLELQELFLNFNGVDKKLTKRLEKLGFKVERKKKHPKMYINLDGKTYIVVLCSTASDQYSGWMNLQRIRRIYEQHEMEKENGTKM